MTDSDKHSSLLQYSSAAVRVYIMGPALLIKGVGFNNEISTIEQFLPRRTNFVKLFLPFFYYCELQGSLFLQSFLIFVVNCPQILKYGYIVMPWQTLLLIALNND